MHQGLDPTVINQLTVGGRVSATKLEADEVVRSTRLDRQAEATKWTCISQNFNDRRARVAHSDWQSAAR